MRRSRRPASWRRCARADATTAQPDDRSGPFGRRAGDTQPCLLVAEHQTLGRGRQGRSWLAHAGASLTFSLGLPLAPRDWSGLSLAVGVALADALEAPEPGAQPTPAAEVAERSVAGRCAADAVASSAAC